MGKTTIEWTSARQADGSIVPGYTFNPWEGCVKVSAGCANCYAEKLSWRSHDVLGEWGINGKRVIAAESYWKFPKQWDKAAERDEVRRKVFCASLADIGEILPQGHQSERDVENARRRLVQIITETPNLDWLLLTKRIKTFSLLWPEWRENWPSNVWVGTSVENQKLAEERIPELLKIPAKIRFLSCEPLLGEVDLTLIPDALYDSGMPFTWQRLDKDERGIKWVIAGGESGPNARPVHPYYIRSLRDQCVNANVPFFFKQWGEWLPLVSADEASEYPRKKMFEWKDGLRSVKTGKKSAGRLLDGKEWNEMP